MYSTTTHVPDSVQVFSNYVDALRNNDGEIYINEDSGKKRKEQIEAQVDKLNEENLTRQERKEALEKLWLHVCFYIVKELKKSKLPRHLFEDALQNSFLKLAQKAHRYDPYFNPEYKTSFVGFLSRCRTISNAVQDAVVSNQVIKNARNARKSALSKLNVDEDDEEEVDEDPNKNMTTLEYQDYMDYETEQDDEHSDSSAERGMYNRELQNLFSYIFSESDLLNQNERIALLAKFGILGHGQMNLRELKDYFMSRMGKDITEARISQIQKEGLNKVRDYLKKHGVDSEVLV